MQNFTIRFSLASIFLLLSSTLSAAEQWRYDEHHSDWLNSQVSFAVAESHGKDPDSFVILCKDDELDAYVHTNAHLGDNATKIDYKIDGISFDETEWTHADSFDGTITFYKCPEQLARQLAQAQQFSVAYSDHSGNNYTVEYSLAQAKQPIEKVLEACA